MSQWVETLIAVAVSLAASSGFWAFVQKRSDCSSATRDMLLGLGHDRIMSLGMCYIERKWITQDEYENLEVYLYAPYCKMNGNGSAKRVMEEVRKLPIRKYPIKQEENQYAAQ